MGPSRLVMMRRQVGGEEARGSSAPVGRTGVCQFTPCRFDRILSPQISFGMEEYAGRVIREAERSGSSYITMTGVMVVREMGEFAC
jgi:hypothetical protein